MQGTVNSGFFCTSTLDKLAKIVYNNSNLIYKYKGVTAVPPLEMVDDVLTFKMLNNISCNEFNSKCIHGKQKVDINKKEMFCHICW